MLCDYGCGQKSRFTMSSGKRCCSKHYNSCPSNKKKNSSGVTKAHKDGRLPGWNGIAKKYGLNRSWAKGKTFVPNEKIFVENSVYSNECVKQRIVKNDLMEYCCSKCGLDSWLEESIVLDLDHINGHNRDMRFENLRYLCPNCHSQTSTYKGRNKNSGRTKVTDQD